MEQIKSIIQKLSTVILHPFKKISHYSHDHVIARKKIIFGTMLVAWFAILITGMVQPRTKRYSADQLITKQSFQNGTGEMKLVSQTYSKDNKIILLKFETTSKNSDSIGIDPHKLKWKLYVKHQDGPMKMEIIPVVDNEITVVIRNVSPHFQALAVDITNQTKDTTTLDPALANSADSSSTDNSSTSKDSNNLQFLIAQQKGKLKTGEVKQLSQKQFALQAIQVDIKKWQNEQRRLDSVIEELNSAINTDKRDIDNLEKKKHYQTGDELTSTNNELDSLNSDISAKQQQVQTAKDNVLELNRRIRLLEKKQVDVQNGKYKFTDSVKTYKLQN